MDFNEVLQFADDLVFAKTGKHLDNVQEAILRGTWQNQKHTKIAEELHRTEGHVRDVASELWKILSEVLGEDLNKSNFRSTLQRSQLFVISSNFAKDSTQINSINVCGETSHPSEIINQRSRPTPNPENPKPQTRQDLRDAPDITPLYDRALELTTLKQWITQESARLVALLGIRGIGKTALTLHLLPQIQHQFEYVIWRSLRTSPPLETTLKNLIKFISNQTENDFPTSTDDRLSLLIEYLRSHRTLIILDDVQTILSSREIAGNYRPEYENYGTLFRLIGETTHNSCLILNSWEPPREIAALTEENAPFRTLYIDGLNAVAAREILRKKGLREEEQWQSLINTYRGNPLWLKIVATTIKEIFRGRVADFLQYDMLFIGEELKSILDQQFNRVSDLEKEVMYRVTNTAEPVSISQLLEDKQLSPSELINAIQSLGRRSLIEKNEQENQMVFTLSPVIQEYVKSLVIRNS